MRHGLRPESSRGHGEELLGRQRALRRDRKKRNRPEMHGDDVRLCVEDLVKDKVPAFMDDKTESGGGQKQQGVAPGTGRGGGRRSRCF
jgi:hypothetical protein